MGKEFVVDPWEDQAWTSCICNEAESPFNCTCPRTDPTSLPTQSMPPEPIMLPPLRLVGPTVMLLQRRPMRHMAPLHKRIPPMELLPDRISPQRRDVEGPDIPSLPAPLNFATAHNPPIIVRPSESQTSNVEAAERIPVTSILRARQPLARRRGDSPGGYFRVTDGRILQVSVEFMNWASGQNRAEVVAAVLRDYATLQRMGIFMP